MTVSIIAVEYHSLDDIKPFVSSLLANAFSTHQIEIIVSSNSRYSNVQRAQIERDYPEVKWCFNKINGGFAYAMNIGLAAATGDVMIIANADCVFPDNLDGMVNFLAAHPEVGAIAPRIEDAEGHLQDSCRSYLSLSAFIKRQWVRLRTHKEAILNPDFDYTKVQTIDWVIGAFIMVTRTAYKKTGGLSNRYFMYAEDMDWCTRIRQAGFEIVYYPTVKVLYKGTRAARKSKKYARIFIKSHLAYWRKFGFFWGYPKRKDLKF